LFATIGYSDQESTGPRSKPSFEKESQRFRVELRKKDFLNPSKLDPVFESLDGSNKLSECMKSFSSMAQSRRRNYINEKLNSNGLPERSFHPIPVTSEEEEKYLGEQSMTKKELLNVIHTLIGSLNEKNRPQFKNLSSKKKDDLLLILQEVKNFNDGVDESEEIILTETNN
jgi:hypothetical protein